MRVKPPAVVEGIVVRGKRLGRLLGIPTANVPYPKSSAMPSEGVYVADMFLLDQNNRLVRGVLNQGFHPTVPEGDPAIEIHIFDFNEDLYGQHVRVRYLEFIRPERIFDSKEDMRLVMQDDLRLARDWFTRHPDYLDDISRSIRSI
jgi:riboflavin kinase/FMN adenylyltransferase